MTNCPGLTVVCVAFFEKFPNRAFRTGFLVLSVLSFFVLFPVQKSAAISLPVTHRIPGIDRSAGDSSFPVMPLADRATSRENPDNPLIDVRYSVSSDTCLHPVDFSVGRSLAVLTCSHDAPLVRIFAGKTFFALLPGLPERVSDQRKFFPPGSPAAVPPVFPPVPSPPPNLPLG